MKKKVILQVSNSYIPGMSYQENIYCRELSKIEELNSLMLVPATNYPKDGTYKHLSNIFKNRIVKPGIYKEDDTLLIRLPLKFEKNGKVIMSKFINAVKIINPDVILVHGSTSLQIIQLSALKWLSKEKFMLLADDHSVLSVQENGFASKLYRIVFKTIFSKLVNKQVDKFLPISNETVQILKKQYSFDETKMKVLPLGADDSIFYADLDKRKALRAELNISDNSCLFVHTGKIIKSKKVEMILEALASVKSDNFMFLIVGPADEEYKSKLIVDIEKLALQNKVIFKNNVSSIELSEIYNAADCGLWPFAPTISAVEAQLCGLPVVLNDALVNVERILSNSNNSSGFIVKDKHTLTEVLGTYLSDSETLLKQKKYALVNSKKYKNSVIVSTLKNIMQSK